VDFEWKPSLALGVGAIDDQHKEIFLRVNDLQEATRQNRGSASLTLLVEFLARYVSQHFADEEKLMDTHKYPDATAHKAEHVKFKAAFDKLRGQHASNGATASLVMEISELTTQWLVNHIGGTDKKLAAFLGPKLKA